LIPSPTCTSLSPKPQRGQYLGTN